MVDLRPRWTMGYPGYGRRSDTMVDPRPRWAMGYPGYSFYSTQVDLPSAKAMVEEGTPW